VDLVGGKNNPSLTLENEMQSQRRFIGGTKGTRGKAALEFLNVKANAVRTNGAVSIVLRNDKKARVTESDLRVWAKDNGFEICSNGNVFHVAIAKVISKAS